MKRTFRKQTQNDFMSRIERLDPQFAKQRPKAEEEHKPWELDKIRRYRSESPIKMSLIGFVLAFCALLGVEDPEMVKSLLLQSGWPGEFLSHAMNGAMIGVVGLIIFFLGNMVRIVNPRATGRGNASGLVFGAIAAIGMINIPDPYIQSGFEIAGFQDVNHVFSYAQERTLQLASIDWASVVMVSSTAK